MRWLRWRVRVLCGSGVTSWIWISVWVIRWSRWLVRSWRTSRRRRLSVLAVRRKGCRMSELREGRVVVPEGATEEAWLEGRSEGVTASEIHRVARGGPSVRREVLDGKLNGSRFRGNAHTRRGHLRESLLVEAAAAEVARLGGTLAPNGALWAAADEPLFLATPDGVGSLGGRIVGAEVKSLTKRPDRIDPSHYSQVQWGLRVLGAERWLYAFEVVDEDGTSLEDPTLRWIERDEEYIAHLEDGARRFIAWREAGAPDVDELDDDLAVALAAWVGAKRVADAASRLERVAKGKLEKLVADIPHAERFGAVRVGVNGGFQRVVSESTVLDEEAWREAAPAEHLQWVKLREGLAGLEAAAIAAHPKAKVARSTRLVERES